MYFRKADPTPTYSKQYKRNSSIQGIIKNSANVVSRQYKNTSKSNTPLDLVNDMRTSEDYTNILNNVSIDENADSCIINLNKPLNKTEKESLINFNNSDVQKEYMIHTYFLPNALPTIHISKEQKHITSIYDMTPPSSNVGLKGTKISTPTPSKTLMSIKNKIKDVDEPEEQVHSMYKTVDRLKKHIMIKYQKKNSKKSPSLKYVLYKYKNSFYGRMPNVVSAIKQDLELESKGNHKVKKIPRNLRIPDDLKDELRIAEINR